MENILGKIFGIWGTFWEPDGTHWELKRNTLGTGEK
jgi:hypothetical protein